MGPGLNKLDAIPVNQSMVLIHWWAFKALMLIRTSRQRILTKGHITGGEFFTVDNIMWSQPVGSIAVSCSSRAVSCCWGPNDPFCCTHCIRDSQCFSMGWTNPKIAPFRGECWAHLTHGTLDPHESASKLHVDWLAILHRTSVCPTDRQTHRQCYMQHL